MGLKRIFLFTFAGKIHFNKMSIKQEQQILSVHEVQKLCLERNIPFCTYKFPNTNDICMGIQLTGSVSDFEKQTTICNDGFIMVPFSESSQCKSLFIRFDLFFINQIDRESIINKIKNIYYPAKKTDIPVFNTSKDAYIKQVSSVIEKLEKRHLKKVVLSRAITAESDTYQRIPTLFYQMSRIYPEAFVFLVSVPGKTTWIGATPETFLSKRKEKWTTMSLAGTLLSEKLTPKLSDWSIKDRNEQEIVTQYISDIFKIVIGSDYSVSETFSRKAGNLYHLCSLIEYSGILSPEQKDKLLEQLHPTPAVGGMPKKAALEIISETEKRDRRYYSGYLGPIKNNGDFDLFVNLRSMELTENCVQLHVGGGITTLSDPEKEWEETVEKSHTLLNLFENAE